MKKLNPVLLVFPVLVLGAISAAASDSLWIHVRVDDDQGSKVRVNLPLSMAEKAVAMVPSDHLDNGKIQLDDREYSVQELRELWAEIQKSPDMTFVTVEQTEESVKVWKEQGKLRVEVRGLDGDRVDVQVPLEVVDALLSGDADELDVGAAIRALSDSGGGEIVAVTDQRENVRVWVDSIAEAD